MSKFVLRVAMLLLVAALLPAGAQARSGHRSHRVKLTGVVSAVSAARHTITVRVKTARHNRRHGRRANLARRSPRTRSVVVDVANAAIHGSDGTVTVGDHVVITVLPHPSGSGEAVAHDVVVEVPAPEVGHGDHGRGAVLPGTVTVVDSAAGTLTLRVHRDEHGVDMTDTTVDVTVDGHTFYAVTDANGDGSGGLDDIAAGDKVVVFTADGSANPVLARGILDHTHRPAGDHHENPGPVEPPHRLTAFPGKVTAVDQNSLTVLVSGDGPLGGHSVTAAVGSDTTYAVADVNGDASRDLNDVAVGDDVVVFTANASVSPVAARGILDRTHPPVNHEGDEHHSPPPPPPAFQYVPGQVTALGADTFTVHVSGDGPLAGHDVTVSTTADTVFRVADTDGSGHPGLEDIALGDQIVLATANRTADPILAWGVLDVTHPSSEH